MSQAIAIHEAYRRGDLENLKSLLGNPPDFPNTFGPPGSIAPIILEYAIYHSPLPFIRALLELGANPNYQDHAGFPSLIAALSTARADKREVVEMLLCFGAGVNERGVNGYTPLHWAAGEDDVEMIELLLGYGADPAATTVIDDDTTALEEAERGGRKKAVEALRRLTAG